ncbi:MAG: MotA/TolQ/ExbB proton channel family protein [Bacteroidetes bacterium]|nr:MotA/TolQ/ExbB proton channel family protein [Bacteroidota bacterium]
MSNKQKSEGSGIGAFFAATVILSSIVVCVLVYMFIMGNPNNFEGGDPVLGHPLPGNTLGIVYKGGFIVPILMSIVVIIIAFSLERFLTISKAKGRGRLNVFVRNLQNMISNNQIEAASKECDKQKGSLANVMKAGLDRFHHLQNDSTMDKEQKIVAMQKELEEATSLELPMLSKNLVIISTCASISTLVGLIGTVLGMIKAFSALAQAGAPDAVALANGISEALINTALGITGSTIAIIMYNYFTTQIDQLTYKIDESGYSLVSTFESQVK